MANKSFMMWITAGIMMVMGMGMAGAAERPNIVVLLADDMGYGDIHAYNSKSQIPTPNLDDLCRSGMRFTDAHSGSAVCTPTRYGLITGRYCWRTRLKRGVLSGYSSHLIDPDRLTVADVLKSKGYYTGCFGKWHLGMDLPKDSKGNVLPGVDQKIQNSPNVNGFDYFYGIVASLDFPPYVFIENDHFTRELTSVIAASRFPTFYRKGELAEGFNHRDALDNLAGRAVDFIHKHGGQQKPFFLYFPMTAPHKPCMPAQRFQGRTQQGDYGDFVVQVDWVVGQIVQALDEMKIRDNTLLIYTSDNGSYMFRRAQGEVDHVDDPSDQGFRVEHHQPNGPWRGTKADVWEAGHRIPFIVRWPGKVKAGTVCQETICLTDIMATCADVVSYQLPDNAAEDSFSLLGLLKGEGWTVPRAPVVNHSVSGMFALRNGPWKMVFGNGSGGREEPRGKAFEKPYFLFNLKDDPGETRNLIDKNPELAKKMEQQLEVIRQSGSSHTVGRGKL